MLLAGLVRCRHLGRTDRLRVARSQRGTRHPSGRPDGLCRHRYVFDSDIVGSSPHGGDPCRVFEVARPEVVVSRIYVRNQGMYGDPIGPSIDYLMR